MLVTAAAAFAAAGADRGSLFGIAAVPGGGQAPGQRRRADGLSAATRTSSSISRLADEDPASASAWSRSARSGAPRRDLGNDLQPGSRRRRRPRRSSRPRCRASTCLVTGFARRRPARRRCVLYRELVEAQRSVSYVARVVDRQVEVARDAGATSWTRRPRPRSACSSRAPVRGSTQATARTTSSRARRAPRARSIFFRRARAAGRGTGRPTGRCVARTVPVFQSTRRRRHKKQEFAPQPAASWATPSRTEPTPDWAKARSWRSPTRSACGDRAAGAPATGCTSSSAPLARIQQGPPSSVYRTQLIRDRMRGGRIEDDLRKAKQGARSGRGDGAPTPVVVQCGTAERRRR